MDQARRLPKPAKPKPETDDEFGPEWSVQARAVLVLTTLLSIPLGLVLGTVGWPLALLYTLFVLPILWFSGSMQAPEPQSAELTTSDVVKAALHRVLVTVSLVFVAILGLVFALFLICIANPPNFGHHP